MKSKEVTRGLLTAYVGILIAILAFVFIESDGIHSQGERFYLSVGDQIAAISDEVLIKTAYSLPYSMTNGKDSLEAEQLDVAMYVWARSFYATPDERWSIEKASDTKSVKVMAEGDVMVIDGEPIQVNIFFSLIVGAIGGFLGYLIFTLVLGLE